MHVLEAIQQRRSVKQYQPDHQLTEAEFQKLMEHVILSPTSFNIQHWRLVRITDSAMREQAKEIAWGQSHVQEASELIVFCGQLDAWKDKPERYWRNADDATCTYLVNMMQDFYQDQQAVQRDEVMRSCAMAAQTLMLTAKAMGYDTNPMIGFDRQKMAELIHLPDNYEIAMIVVLGKAKEPAHARGGQLALNEVLFENTF